MTVITNHAVRSTAHTGGTEQLVTFGVGGQIFGLSALRVRDVLRQQPLTPIPLAKPEIAGAINLRGHIVPAIDMRARLWKDGAGTSERKMCVVVEKDGEPYCLIVDSVGDVLTVELANIESAPSSLPPEWAGVTRGLYRMGERLLLLIDEEALLKI